MNPQLRYQCFHTDQALSSLNVSHSEFLLSGIVGYLICCTQLPQHLLNGLTIIHFRCPEAKQLHVKMERESESAFEFRAVQNIFRVTDSSCRALPVHGGTTVTVRRSDA